MARRRFSRNDRDVFTLSIHQENNYPMPKPPSDEDMGLEDGTRDHEYLDALEKGLRCARGIDSGFNFLRRRAPTLIAKTNLADWR